MPFTKNNKGDRPSISLICLALSICAILALNALWIHSSDFSLRGDSARHAFAATIWSAPAPNFLSDSHCVVDHRQGQIAISNRNDLSSESERYKPALDMLRPTSEAQPIYPFPQLLQALTHPLVRLAGFRAAPFFAIQALFTLIAMGSLYACGRALHSERIGILSCWALLGSLYLPCALRTYLLDYPLTALLLLQFALYLHSERLTKLPQTLGFLACLPLLAGLKVQYLAFELPLLAAVFLDMTFLRAKAERISPRTALTSFQILLALALGCALVSAQFCPGFAEYLCGHDLGSESRGWMALLGYFAYLKGEVTAPLFAWIYVPCLLWALYRWPRRPQYALILLPLLIGPLFYAFSECAPRWLAPLWPLRCLLIALVFGDIEEQLSHNPWPGRLFSVACLASALVLNAGWLCPSPLWEQVPALTLSSDFDRSYLRDIAEEDDSFWNTHSRWSSQALFTFTPYRSDWKQALQQISDQVPNGSAIYHGVPLTPPPPGLDYEITAGTELTAWINFNLYGLGRKDLEVRLEDPPYPAGQPVYVLITQEPQEAKKLEEIYPQASGEELYHGRLPRLDLSLWRLR